MDILVYLSPAPNDHLDGRELNSNCPSTSSQIFMRRELNSLHEELSLKRKISAIFEKSNKKDCPSCMEVWNPQNLRRGKKVS